MKQILFIAAANLHERNGGALATLAYYNAFRHLYEDKVDLVLPKEFCHGNYVNAIPVPRRNRLITYLGFFKGRYHRYKDFLFNYLQRNHRQYDLVVINGGLYAGDMMDMFHFWGIKIIVIHHNSGPHPPPSCWSPSRRQRHPRLRKSHHNRHRLRGQAHNRTARHGQAGQRRRGR